LYFGGSGIASAKEPILPKKIGDSMEKEARVKKISGVGKQKFPYNKQKIHRREFGLPKKAPDLISIFSVLLDCNPLKTSSFYLGD